MMLEYHCTKCGFSSSGEDEESELDDSLFVGFGMMDVELLKEKFPHADDELIFKVSGRQPHYCTGCQLIFVNGLGDDPVVCPQCHSEAQVHSYTSPEAMGKDRSEVGDNEEIILTEGKFYCPKCRSISLEFTASGMWD